jgi:hypothetical protein
MNVTQCESLWNILRQSGIVAGDMPDRQADPSPWYVRAMIGISAWVAALFLLAFVAIGLPLLFRSPDSMAIVGLIVCAAAIAIMRAAGTSLFLSQLALAGSLAGQALVAFGTFERAAADDLPHWLIFGAFEVALVALAPDYVHRVLATAAALVAAQFSLAATGMGTLFAPLVAAGFVALQLQEVRLAPRAALWQPVAIGLALALFLSVTQTMFFADGLRMWTSRSPAQLPPWVGSLAMGVVLPASVWGLLRDAQVPLPSPPGRWAMLAALVLAVAAWPVPGLTATAVVMLVAFARGQQALLGFALLAQIGALGHYYYSLQTTLFVKAGALLVTGLVLLAARYALSVVTLRAEESTHA